MTQKIKMFEGLHIYELEDKINKWFQDNPNAWKVSIFQGMSKGLIIITIVYGEV